MTSNHAGKTMSVTCNNCDRLSEIEGEKVCFDQGEINRLTYDTRSDSIIRMVCNSWAKN